MECYVFFLFSNIKLVTKLAEGSFLIMVKAAEAGFIVKSYYKLFSIII